MFFFAGENAGALPAFDRMLDKSPHRFESLPMRKAFLFGIPILILLCALVAVIGNLLVQRYLSGEAFRKLVGEKTSAALGVRGDYEQLQWQGFRVYSPGFFATGEDNSQVRMLELEDLRTTFNWRAIFDGVWKLDDIEIGLAAIELKSEQSAPPQVSLGGDPAPSPGMRTLPSWFPKKFEPGRIGVADFSMDSAFAKVGGVRVQLERDGGAWVLDGQDGELAVTGLPRLRISSFRGRISDDRLFLTDFSSTIEPSGRLHASGEIHPATSGASLRIRWEGVDLGPLLPETHAAFFTGRFSGEADLRQERDAQFAGGKFLIEDASLRNVPMFESLAAFTGAPQFRNLPVQKISGRFSKDSKGIRVESFFLESLGLLRIEGSVSVGAAEELSADLLVGLTPQTLRWIPGSREKVFVEERSGYLWASMTLSGTLQNPKEDLSSRLATAAGQQLIEGGARKLFESSGEGAVEGVNTILDLLFPANK